MTFPAPRVDAAKCIRVARSPDSETQDPALGPDRTPGLHPEPEEETRVGTRGVRGDPARGRFQPLRGSARPYVLTISGLSRRPLLGPRRCELPGAARGRCAPTLQSAESDVHALFLPRDL